MPAPVRAHTKSYIPAMRSGAYLDGRYSAYNALPSSTHSYIPNKVISGKISLDSSKYTPQLIIRPSQAYNGYSHLHKENYSNNSSDLKSYAYPKGISAAPGGSIERDVITHTISEYKSGYNLKPCEAVLYSPHSLTGCRTLTPGVLSQISNMLSLSTTLQCKRHNGNGGGQSTMWELTSYAGNPESWLLKITRPTNNLRMHTDAQNLARIKNMHPSIQYDDSLCFPIYFGPVKDQSSNSSFGEFFLMPKLRGQCLHWVINNTVDTRIRPNAPNFVLNSLMEKFGHFLKVFHDKYHMQHGDLQTSNILYDAQTAKFCLVDIGAMGSPHTIGKDLEHFESTIMTHFAPTYGRETMRSAMQSLRHGYRSR